MATTDTKKRFIGLDLGTSAIKGVVIDENGKILGESKKETSFIYPATGLVELEPEQHYRDMCCVIRELTAAANGRITAIAMAAASGNTLLTDKTGKPLTNIISWLDKRAELSPPKTLKKLNSTEVTKVTGWPCINIFPLGHLAWLKENRSKLYKETAHYCMNSDWLLFRLTGKWQMDYSTATTFHLQEQVTGKYYRPYLEMLDISIDKLSVLSDSGVSIGKLTATAAAATGTDTETIAVTGCFDHPAAARGMGINIPGQLMLSCGTSWVGFFPENDRDRILELGLLCDPFLSTKNGPWGAIFSVPQIGQNIDWYVDNLIAPGQKDKYRIFDQLASRSGPGANGLVIDLSEPPKKIDASKSDISRAVMEAAARALNEKIASARSRGISFKQAIMVGGPSNSSIWPKITEKITGISIKVGSQHAGAFGAALLAAKGAGITI